MASLLDTDLDRVDILDSKANISSALSLNWSSLLSNYELNTMLQHNTVMRTSSVVDQQQTAAWR